MFTAKTVRGREVTLNFTRAAGLKTLDGGAPTGFSLAGEDQKFHAATAVLRGAQVVLSSPAVEKPVAVRYGWADHPVVNLANGAGLPASPFRTDSWELTTQKIK